MLSRSEEIQLRDLFSEALMLVCRNTVLFENQLGVKALVGLTIDSEQVCMLDVNSVLYKSEKIESGERSQQTSDPIRIVKQSHLGRIGGQPSIQTLTTNTQTESKEAHAPLKPHSSKRSRSESIEQPTGLSHLYSEIEELAERVKRKGARKRQKKEAVEADEIVAQKENSGCTVVICEDITEAVVSGDGDDDNNDDADSPNETTKSSCPELASLEQINDASHVFSLETKASITPSKLSSSALQEEHIEQWPPHYHIEDNNSSFPDNSIQPKVEELEVALNEAPGDMEGMIQTVIVGENAAAAAAAGGGEFVVAEAVHVEYMDGVTDEEPVLVMAGMEADTASALHHMQPGETFQYNGTTYQIAADEVTGDAMVPAQHIKQEGKEVVMKKGNHTKSEKPKKFCCSICVQQFTTSWGLKLHERLHKGHFRYYCKICNKGFTSSVNIRGHMVKHNQQKEFACEYCGKTFSYRQSLERHQTKKGDAPCSGLKKTRKPLMPKPESNDTYQTALEICNDEMIEVEPVEVTA